MFGSRARLLTVFGLCVTVAACPDDDDDESSRCVELDAASCAPLYTPTFDNVYTETLRPRCAVEGGSCHANPDAVGARNGFWFDTPERAYGVLLGERGDATWVVPEDVECSPLMSRLQSDDPFFVMPPGSQPMPLGVRCSIAQWIASGAER